MRLRHIPGAEKQIEESAFVDSGARTEEGLLGRGIWQ